MRSEPEPDDFEKGVRFGCGFLLGVVATIGVVLHGASLLAEHPWVAGAVLGVLLGLLAMWYGDKFWEALGKWWRWW